MRKKKVPPTPKRSGPKEEREIEYIEEATIVNRVTITSYRPILTAEERQKRDQQVIDVLTSIARSGKGFLKKEEK